MSLRFETVTIRSADFHGVSSLPSLSDLENTQNMTESVLDEDDGLFIGFGYLNSIFPYRMQDLYDRGLNERGFEAAVLENEYLKAVFLPELGGKMWSLYDKKAGRDLLYENTVVRPCNLALRNAWCAGGIEYNCGMVGHGPFTCDRVFAARTQLDDGTPVLRMYEYERIRSCVYQMDFFLPEDSPVLFGRMRIVNPNRETVPMYWWTNIAVPERKDCRTVCDAHEAYTNEGGAVRKVPAPIHGGRDITYPTNNPVAVDYFWKIPDGRRKFTTNLDGSGYGFFQASTDRQRGRKLFVWGQGPGGARWQEFLTEDGSDRRYTEIQAGIGHTQYECLPMPPNSAWEWLESYGGMQADPQKVHGGWDDAIAEVTARLDETVPLETLDALLSDTHKMATSPASLVTAASGWGKLENLRRIRQKRPVMCPHLDFGSVGEEQQPWLSLLENGKMPEIGEQELPVSWMLQNEWTDALLRSAECHEKYLQLAAIYVANGQLPAAKEAIGKALSFRRSPAALFIEAQLSRLSGDVHAWAGDLYEAQRRMPADISLSREALQAALTTQEYGKAIELYRESSDTVRSDGRSRMLCAFALLRNGDVEGAERMLYADGGLVVGDIRECEISLTQLYIDIMRKKAEQRNEPFEEAALRIPKQFDYRMFVE